MIFTILKTKTRPITLKSNKSPSDYDYTTICRARPSPKQKKIHTIQYNAVRELHQYGCCLSSSTQLFCCNFVIACDTN